MFCDPEAQVFCGSEWGGGGGGGGAVYGKLVVPVSRLGRTIFVGGVNESPVSGTNGQGMRFVAGFTVAGGVRYLANCPRGRTGVVWWSGSAATAPRAAYEGVERSFEGVITEGYRSQRAAVFQLLNKAGSP